MVVLLQVFYTYLLRKTLLKKGSSSNSFPKTFSIKFPPDISHSENIIKISYLLD